MAGQVGDSAFWGLFFFFLFLSIRGLRAFCAGELHDTMIPYLHTCTPCSVGMTADYYYFSSKWNGITSCSSLWLGSCAVLKFEVQSSTVWPDDRDAMP